MNGVRHRLDQEFPEFQQTIHSLKQNDPQFAQLVNQYNKTDKAIYGFQQKFHPVVNHLVEQLKRERVRLKDAIFYKLQSAAKFGAT